MSFPFKLFHASLLRTRTFSYVTGIIVKIRLTWMKYYFLPHSPRSNISSWLTNLYGIPAHQGSIPSWILQWAVLPLQSPFIQPWSFGRLALFCRMSFYLDNWCFLIIRHLSAGNWDVVLCPQGVPLRHPWCVPLSMKLNLITWWEGVCYVSPLQSY